MSDVATLLMIESWLQSTGLSLPPLIRARGHRYVLLTRDPSLYPQTPGGAQHPVLEYADDVVVADTNDRRALADAVTGLARRRPIEGVLTTCDYYLEAVAVCARMLRLPGPPAEVVRLANLKHQVRAATRLAGLPTPGYAVAGTWEAARAGAKAIGFPLVAKPVDLNSGSSVRRIDDEAGLKDAFWEVTSLERNTRDQPLCRLLLMEELLEGREVSVEAVTCAATTTIIGITEKSVTGSPEFVESGHLFPARLDPNLAADVATFVRQALDAIGYTHGLSHTEVILTAHGPRIVEMNPRQAGGYIFDLVHLVTGTHPLEVLIDLALGRAPRVGTPTAPLSSVAPVASAAVSFVMSPRDGLVVDVEGTERLDADLAVRRWQLSTPARARRPRDNNDRLGYVLAVDPAGDQARARAEAALAVLRLRMADGALLVPGAP